MLRFGDLIGAVAPKPTRAFIDSRRVRFAPLSPYGAKLLRRFAQRLGVDRVVELRALPLRTEQALLDGAAGGRADLVARRAQVAQAVEADVHDGRSGERDLEQD